MNPLFQAMSQGSANQSIANIVRMLKNGNPEQIAMNLMQTNPQFRAFMQSVQGKTPEQFCQEHGVDFKEIMNGF